LYGRWDRGVFLVDTPKGQSGKTRIIQFEELKKAVARKISFSQYELSAITRVQDHGNLTAHFASKRIEGIQRWEQEVIRETNRLMQNSPDPRKWLLLNEKLERNSQTWVTPDEALEDLRDTSLVLQTLLVESARQQAASVSIVTV
jgi:hypothetical protein